MPETDFFGENHDVEGIVQYALSNGLYIVPDLRYPTPSMLQIHELESYKRIAVQRNEIVGPFLLMKPGVSEWPLEIRGVDGTTGHFYYPVQRHGGPSISLSPSYSYELDATRWLTQGALSYYATYKNTLTGDWEKIPAGLRAVYHDMARYIKGRGRLLEQECIGGGIRKFWILPEAQKALKGGARLVGFEHVDNLAQ